jgi:hypothetical protein
MQKKSRRASCCVAVGRLAALLICCGLSSGCFTIGMWGSGFSSTRESVLVEEVVERASGSLRLSPAGLDFARDGSESLCLTPVEVGGDLALAVLADPEYCEILDARIDSATLISGEVVKLEGEALEDSSSLTLQLSLHKNALAEIVSELSLPEDVRRQLASGGVEVDDLPDACRACLEQLVHLDFRWLVGARAATP